jgi:hypothetical protein
MYGITKYYSCLHTSVATLSDLIRRQLLAQCYAHSSSTEMDYLTGSKRLRPKESKKNPLNHNAVIIILHYMCLLLCIRQIPDSADFLQPYYLTKKDRTSILYGKGLTNILDLGGGRHLKKRRIMCRIQGPIQTAL